ncbi:MAG: carboxypeptidase regulatory-like domain-containing protein [Thermoplasmata archaeon]
MDRESNSSTFYDPYTSGLGTKPGRQKRRLMGPGSAPSRLDGQRTLIFNLGKLQIAGILLILVFIWGVVSAVAIAMYEIDPPASLEFEDDGKGDVSGFVYDENGISLVNVTVTVHGTQHFTRTNEEGFYSIKNVSEGDYEIEASLEGYGSVTKRVSIDAYIPALVRFTLEEGGFEKTKNERYGSSLSDLRFLNHAPAIFILIYSSLALIGGILAYFQRFFWIAMFGALCGIVSGVLSIGIIIASILSVIALVFILRHQGEFITSETSFVDRLFGVHRDKTGARGVQRKGVRRLKPYGPQVKPKTKAMEPRFAEKDYTPDMDSPAGEMEPTPQDDSEGISEPSPNCVACGGAVKAETQGVQCQCGANYHKFCANSNAICKNCGSSI